MNQLTKAKIRKNNMKLYPIYEMFGLDFMFYYVIELLFFVQVKGIDVSQVVLLSSLYSGFCIMIQFVIVPVVSKIGKKRGMLLGNVLNLISILTIIFGNQFWIFIIAKAMCAVGFGLKNITESTFLNSTIPATKNHGYIFTRIDGKGYSKYSYFRSITALMSGFLFDINPYIPMFLCVSCILFTIIIAINFKEIEEENTEKEREKKKEIKDIKNGFKFILKSKRLKALLLMIALIWALLCVQSTYNTALLKEIGISASVLGIISALLEMIKGVYATKANEFNKRYSNKLLTLIALVITITMIISGLITLIPIDYRLQAMIITVFTTIIYVAKGVYQIIKKRYMSNFVKTDTLLKIYSANSIIDNIIRMIVSYVASIALNIMNIRQANLFIGILFTIITLLTSLYMKNRVGLKPKDYAKSEIELIK